MNSEDTDYYRMRANEERQAAQAASEQHIADIHLELARAYEALLEYPELRAGPRRAAG